MQLVTETVIIDADILVDIARGVPAAISCLQKTTKSSYPAIIAVTQMELIVECRNKPVLKQL